MDIPDPLKKTVKIPVRVTDGKVRFFYGGELPRMADTVGDLIVPAYAFLDETDVENLSFEGVSEILPADSELMINVRVDQYQPSVFTKLRNPLMNLPTAPKDGFVRVILSEPLRLWHRGTKSSVLCPCACSLPDLGRNAESLNHAYTIASKTFETKRIANGGNVFLHVYHQRNNGWERLEWLRDRFDAQFEQRYVNTDARIPDDLDEHSSLFESSTTEAEYPQLSTRQRFRSDPKRPFQESGQYDVNEQEFDELMSEGWYHYDHRFWRYNTRGNFTAVPLRIRLGKFRLSKSQRRVLRINADVDVKILPLIVEENSEESRLFWSHRSRLTNAPEKVPLPECNELNRKFCVYDDGRLIAASYFEMGSRSSYGYYGIFAPEIEWRSLGVFTMLNEIEYAREQGNEFYYLGYAFEEPSRLDYKKRFHALESYHWQGVWKPHARLTGITP